jgi:hypothetical protein
MAETIDFYSNLSPSDTVERRFGVICSLDCYMNCYTTKLRVDARSLERRALFRVGNRPTIQPALEAMAIPRSSFINEFDLLIEPHTSRRYSARVRWRQSI